MAKYLTETEVIKYSSAGKDFPTKPVCDCLDDVEETFINECLGTDLDEHLTGLLQSLPDNVAEWQDCNSYAAGDVVDRNGIYYEAAADYTSSDPLDENGDWAEYDRFTSECANQLWTRYLRKILALMVFKCAIPEATHRTGAGGLTVQGQDPKGERAATGSEIARKQMDVQARIDSIMKNMRIWMAHEDREECDFPSSAMASECADCGKSDAIGRRRFAMR